MWRILALAIHNANAATFMRPSPQVSQSNRVPAPVFGIDARTVLSSGDPMFCIYSFNLLPSEYGLRVRRGYREWQIDIDNGNPLGVGTIIPFGGLDEDATDDRLFAVTNEGIWDVTAEEGTPILKIDFTNPVNGGNTTAAAGHGVYAHYTTDAAIELLYYADSMNGLFQYSQATDLWIRATGIVGPDVAQIDFVMAHKKQLWMIERSKSYAWYLPEASITGDASQFFFGTKFNHGSNLAGCFTWTIDGGAGIDDFFVAVSRAGDVLIYKGSDPSSADTWQSTGQYFIGAIPTGSRFASESGGNLNLLSIFGLTAMDEIVRGVDGKNIRANTESLKIAAIIRRAMIDYRNEYGWDVKVIPSQGSLLISQPATLDGVYLQYAMNTTTTGWGMWRGVPMTAFDEWNGKVYFGDKTSRVCVMDVGVDDMPIDPQIGDSGQPISFSLLTTFQDYGQPTIFKRIKYIRPDFVSKLEPQFSVKARFDYDLEEVLNISMDPATGSSLWDYGTWDQSLWGGNTMTGWHEVRGSFGMGRMVAIAMSGKSRDETTFVSWDVVWDSGSPL